MRTIDIHAHVVPRSLWNAIEAKREWYGHRHEAGDGRHDRQRRNAHRLLFAQSPLHAGGAPEGHGRTGHGRAGAFDPHAVLRPSPRFRAGTRAGAGRERGNRRHGTRVAGALRRSGDASDAGCEIRDRGARTCSDEAGPEGAELGTHVNGEQWDEPKFRPFFKAAEQMGAVLFFHPQPQNNFLFDRIPRHGLSNSLGVILDDAIVTAVLITGGVLEGCPDLRVCIAHGGGPACYAMGRIDRGCGSTPGGPPHTAATQRVSEAPVPTAPLRAARRHCASCSTVSAPTASSWAATGRSWRGRLARRLGAGLEVAFTGRKRKDSLAEPGVAVEVVACRSASPHPNPLPACGARERSSIHPRACGARERSSFTTRACMGEGTVEHSPPARAWRGNARAFTSARAWPGATPLSESGAKERSSVYSIVTRPLPGAGRGMG